ncbi:hypothetical protein LXL04_002624 [Taraxacum kok-saghyz]
MSPWSNFIDSSELTLKFLRSNLSRGGARTYGCAVNMLDLKKTFEVAEQILGKHFGNGKNRIILQLLATRFSHLLNTYMVIDSIEAFFHKCDICKTFAYTTQQVIVCFAVNVKKRNDNGCQNYQRHIRRRHKTIRQLISTGVITIDYVKSKDNNADPLTKGLSRDAVYKSSRGMGLKPLNE